MRRIATAVSMAAFVAVQPAMAKKLFVQIERFNPDEIAWASASGSAQIKGSAVLRTVGGEAKTCAGLPVLLIPVSAYSKERMVHQFGTDDRGLQLPRSKPFAETNPGYLSTMRRTRCDAVGAFEFTGLPKGAFYVIAEVSWNAPSQFGLRPQGGEILERVELQEGEGKQVVLTS